MPAEWNHKEKCNFTWKVEVLTWESCDGFCKGKQKFRIREGDITGKATVHISTDLQHPKRAGVWLCPTDLGVVWGASQPHTGEKPCPGQERTGCRKLRLGHRLQWKKCVRLRVIWLQLVCLSHLKTIWPNNETLNLPKISKNSLVSVSTLASLFTWELCHFWVPMPCSSPSHSTNKQRKWFLLFPRYFEQVIYYKLLDLKSNNQCLLLITFSQK